MVVVIGKYRQDLTCYPCVAVDGCLPYLNDKQFSYVQGSGAGVQAACDCCTHTHAHAHKHTLRDLPCRWGYAPDEKFTVDDLLKVKYQVRQHFLPSNQRKAMDPFPPTHA